MKEIDIKRVNFFDGQYLQKEEFIDLSNYIVHMRRRLLFVMFRKSGVIQAEDDDLKVVVPDASQKKFHVTVGMAVGCVPDAAEAREIVLREDSPTIDLNAQATSFQAGDKVIVTVRYQEQLVNDPPSEGDIPSPTRILEKAVIEVHRNAPPATATDADPYVILGEIDFATMAATIAQRQVAGIQTALFASVPGIRIQPNQVTAGQDVNMLITSTGNFTLSTVTTAQITIQPATGISNLVVSQQQATSLRLALTLDPDAAAGARTVKIVVNNVSAQDTLSILPGLTVTGFQGVNVPAANKMFRIQGTGFAAPTTVQFTKSGGLTDPILLLSQNIGATELRIPMEQIPAEATKGPVQIQSNGQVRKSNADVTPPARITIMPLQGQRNSPLTISGTGFAFGLTAIAFSGGTVSKPPFPRAGESLSPDGSSLTVTVPGTAAAGVVSITTDGGTVSSATSLSVL